MNAFYNFITQILVSLYQLTGSLGWSILTFTLILKLATIPLSLNFMKTQKEIKKLAPEIKALKKKHKDPKEFQLAQAELYKKYNINPLSGCLPQLLQIVILLGLYQVLIRFLGKDVVLGVEINPSFFWLDLRHPDKTFILPILAGVSQLIQSIMILPGGETADIIPNNSKSKKIQVQNQKEEDTADMAASLQKQMLFALPAMTVFFATRFPSGLALYWVFSTVLGIIQQYFTSGWGGLSEYSLKAINFVKSKINVKA